MKDKVGRFVRRQDPEKWQAIFLWFATGVFLLAFFFSTFLWFLTDGRIRWQTLIFMAGCTVAISPVVKPGAYTQIFIATIELCCLQVVRKDWLASLFSS